MVNVRDVANWFLAKDTMTHKKVQKLCYYAQAWYCTLFDGAPLFADEVEAWVHGPVIPALYPVFADYRWSLIPQRMSVDMNFDKNVIEVLEAVYNTYGSFSGDQLESLTHNEKPWIDARGDCKPYDTCTNVITPQAMREFYGEQYRRFQND